MAKVHQDNICTKVGHIKANMDNLQAKLEQLEDRELDYVLERSQVSSDSAALRNAGISRGWFYELDEVKREELKSVAQDLKRAATIRAMLILQGAVEDAAQLKVDGMKDRDRRLAQSCSTEVMDRTMGKPTQRQELTGANGGGVKVEIEYVNSPYTDS